LREWRESRRFQALEPERRSIVFYAEDAASRTHFDPILRELTGRMGRDVAYLTSSPSDPILEDANPRVQAFYIGAGTVRSSVFLGLQADVCVMTIPELQKYQLKRSRVHPVHYAYVFHSMVSTHMIYRKRAFDHYDSVLCVGPHHVAEIRATEALHGLEPKTLVEHGYGRLDSLLERRAERGPRPPRADGEALHVLVAPSWGSDGLVERHGVELAGILLDAGYRVTMRPHPVTRQKWPAAIDSLGKDYGAHERFVLEEDIGSQDSLHAADVMISDWSGAALEYAFAFERPVVFVDLPRKINNPDYTEIPCEPLEVSIRPRIGVVIAEGGLAQLPAEIDRLCADPLAFAASIRDELGRAVYNVGTSGRSGAEYISGLVDA
jgi:YidC/Oxa1 family membrane protein insertase